MARDGARARQRETSSLQTRGGIAARGRINFVLKLIELFVQFSCA